MVWSVASPARVFVLASLAAWISGCSRSGASHGVDAGPSDAGPSDLRVLFVGNSYTYVNDLPAMLAQIAATAGTPPAITTDEVVQGGATLEEHWDNGIAQEKIEEGTWTHVVLQGQSVEPLPFFAGTFSTYAQMFDDLIVHAGARPTLFVTWARADGDSIYAPGAETFVNADHMQDELTNAYADVAGRSPEAMLACVGEAFRRARAQYPDIVLQQADLSHPTVAGTYLAACTFYVALTGNPVPASSMVPTGLDTEDASRLRELARVGSQCGDVPLKGTIFSRFEVDTNGAAPFDFGTAGLSIPTLFYMKNKGGETVGIHDGMSLASPFVWSGGGAYPGGTGTAADGTTFCSNALAPGSTCVVSLAYAATSSGSGSLSLDLTDSYVPTVTRGLHGEATTRALLTVSTYPGLFGNLDSSTSVPDLSTAPGATASLTLFVVNRGAVPVTSLREGTPLSPPFGWASGAFPGGSGDVTWNDVSYPYCSATLGVGEQCALAVTFSPVADGTYTGAVNLAYEDGLGPIVPNANRNIGGLAASLPPGGRSGHASTRPR